MEYVMEAEESANSFSYGRFWQAQEPVINAHKRRAAELGLLVDGVPVSPALTRFGESLRRIENMFDMVHAAEEGINVRQLLMAMTEQQVMDYLAESGIEEHVSIDEVEKLLAEHDYETLMCIPFLRKAFNDLRQVEESASGNTVDVSAFASNDFQKMLPEFDAYRYFLDKTADRVKDLGIMYSCISSEHGRQQVLQRYVSLMNGKFRNRAVRLLAIYQVAEDEAQKEEINSKMQEANRNIRRMKAVWKKYSEWK